MKFADIPSVDAYVRKGLQSFLDDPPASDHQRGYMSALMKVAQHALYWPENNDVLVKARRVYNKTLL